MAERETVKSRAGSGFRDHQTTVRRAVRRTDRARSSPLWCRAVAHEVQQTPAPTGPQSPPPLRTAGAVVWVMPLVSHMPKLATSQLPERYWIMGNILAGVATLYLWLRHVATVGSVETKTETESA